VVCNQEVPGPALRPVKKWRSKEEGKKKMPNVSDRAGRGDDSGYETEMGKEVHDQGSELQEEGDIISDR